MLPSSQPRFQDQFYELVEAEIARVLFPSRLVSLVEPCLGALAERL